VSDSDGHPLGLALTMTRSSVTVLTPAGYQAIFSWDGKLAGSQMYWTGPSCTSGTAYLNSGSPTAASITPKVIAYAKTTDKLLIPATIGSDGLSPVVPNVAVQSIDNNPCGASSTGSGYLLKETTADAVGLPDQVVGPLTTS
jgi:hypothetical protein